MLKRYLLFLVPVFLTIGSQVVSSVDPQFDKLNSSYTSSVSKIEIYLFNRAIKKRLPVLKSYFKKYAIEFSLPWKLLAAIAYQESHWHMDAESFTGVKGLMMLTEVTAEEMGIFDRTDLDQSIWAGAKYFSKILGSQNNNLYPEEKLFLALASYNVGIGHLQDAKRIALDNNLNPESWLVIKEILPTLNNPQVYFATKYGEARGQEPVDFANRVMAFYNHLNSIRQ